MVCVLMVCSLWICDYGYCFGLCLAVVVLVATVLCVRLFNWFGLVCLFCCDLLFWLVVVMIAWFVGVWLHVWFRLLRFDCGG